MGLDWIESVQKMADVTCEDVRSVVQSKQTRPDGARTCEEVEVDVDVPFRRPIRFGVWFQNFFGVTDRTGTATLYLTESHPSQQQQQLLVVVGWKNDDHVMFYWFGFTTLVR
jgi:hypothetical protein